MKKTMIKLFVIFGLVFSFTSFANEGEAPEMKGACRGDVEKFCKGIKPGQGRIARCLRAHQAELSPECKAKIADVKEKRQERRKERREKRKEARKAAH